MPENVVAVSKYNRDRLQRFVPEPIWILWFNEMLAILTGVSTTKPLVVVAFWDSVVFTGLGNVLVIGG